jgi:rRNA-processing protein FCF1
VGNLTLRVVLDSNFLFIPSKFRGDIFEKLKKLLNQQFNPVLLQPTYQELLRIAEHGPPKLRQQASLALKLAQKCSIVSVEIHCEENPDDVILRVAKEWKCPVATNDRELRKRLRRDGVPTIFLRQRAYLAMEGLIH